MTSNIWLLEDMLLPFTAFLDIQRIWFWINPKVENAVRIFSVLKEFGFQSLGIQAGDLTNPEQTIQLGHPPEKIDMITIIDGAEFSECYHKGIKYEDPGVTINVIDLEKLIKNKKALGRAQEIADLEKII